ncbi:DUF3244 domain-containing protein [Phocaeicola sp.]
MKTKLVLFLAIVALATSFSYARTSDETRIIILEALDNEKTRSVIDVPIQAQVLGNTIFLQAKQDIGYLLVEITNINGVTVYTNHIASESNQHYIDLSFFNKSEDYTITIISQQGIFQGDFSL